MTATHNQMKSKRFSIFGKGAEKKAYRSVSSVLLAGALLVALPALAQDVRHRTHNGGSTTIHEITYPSGKTFYNFEINLTSRNTSLEMMESEGRARSNPIQEGYFEVYVNKASLPITVRSCKGDKVILAMPWGGTDPKSSRNRQRAQLYKRILRMMKRNSGRVKVVLEAIPSLTRGLSSFGEDTIKHLDMSSCKLYFRTHKGKVISYAGLLRK